MSDNKGGILVGVLSFIVFAPLSAEARGSPCVYSHSWITDLVNGNDQKRTCSALLKEGNSRIEVQQAQINSLTEQIEALHAEPAMASPTARSPVAGHAQDAPTLSAQVDSEVAHADDDDD